ncbi:MAG: hypothetical protein K8S56_03190 [Candidatus Cloacimonetes bacterium]|nr:hypothetical protein [Candidatus Cloacimonadota bacterium]
MKKFCKCLFRAAFWGAIAYFGYRFYQRVKAVSGISKSMPLFLKNVLGEKPSMALNLAFSSMHIVLGFSKETLEKEENIEELVREYLDDFYPVFNGMSISIKISEREEESGEDDGCCSDEVADDEIPATTSASEEAEKNEADSEKE